MINHDDQDDQDSGESDADEQFDNTIDIHNNKKHKFNKRQRFRHKQTIATKTLTTNNCTEQHDWNDEDIRDAVVADAVVECDWIGVSDAEVGCSHATQPHLRVGNGKRSGVCHNDGRIVCYNGATRVVGYDAVVSSRLGGGPQKQQEGPFVRMMQRTELHSALPIPPWRREKHLQHDQHNCKCIHKHIDDHNQPNHNNIHNHIHEHDHHSHIRNHYYNDNDSATIRRRLDDDDVDVDVDVAHQMSRSDGAPKPTFLSSGGSPPLGVSSIFEHLRAPLLSNSSQLSFLLSNGGGGFRSEEPPTKIVTFRTCQFYTLAIRASFTTTIGLRVASCVWQLARIPMALGRSFGCRLWE